MNKEDERSTRVPDEWDIKSKETAQKIESELREVLGDKYYLAVPEGKEVVRLGKSEDPKDNPYWKDRENPRQGQYGDILRGTLYAAHFADGDVTFVLRARFSDNPFGAMLFPSEPTEGFKIWVFQHDSKTKRISATLPSGESTVIDQPIKDLITTLNSALGKTRAISSVSLNGKGFLTLGSLVTTSEGFGGLT